MLIVHASASRASAWPGSFGPSPSLTKAGSELYVGKRVPVENRKRGAANPIKCTWRD
jgi:hypothetical protein